MKMYVCDKTTRFHGITMPVGSIGVDFKDTFYVCTKFPKYNGTNPWLTLLCYDKTFEMWDEPEPHKDNISRMIWAEYCKKGRKIEKVERKDNVRDLMQRGEKGKSGKLYYQLLPEIKKSAGSVKPQDGQIVHEIINDKHFVYTMHKDYDYDSANNECYWNKGTIKPQVSKSAGDAVCTDKEYRRINNILPETFWYHDRIIPAKASCPCERLLVKFESIYGDLGNNKNRLLVYKDIEQMYIGEKDTSIDLRKYYSHDPKNHTREGFYRLLKAIEEEKNGIFCI